MIEAAGGIDAAVVEAAALAHDLGHPPFGHVAESELNDLLTNAGAADGFEGNAQSFRIVTNLGVHFPDVPGLDLSRATLCALLKYPWMRGGSVTRPTKWGAYTSEFNDFRWARAMLPADSHDPSLEADLMDWADDVAYAVNDLDDFFRAGRIPLDRLAIDGDERNRFLEAEFARGNASDSARLELNRVFESLASLFPLSRPYQGTRVDRAALRGFTSRLIGDYIGSVAVVECEPDRFAVRVDPVRAAEVALLKGLTWYYVINSPSLMSQRFGQRSLIRSLFAILQDAAESPRDVTIFPAFYQELLKDASDASSKLRIVADYISSMSETEAVELHRQLTGQELGSAMDHVM